MAALGLVQMLELSEKLEVVTWLQQAAMRKSLALVSLIGPQPTSQAASVLGFERQRGAQVVAQLH